LEIFKTKTIFGYMKQKILFIIPDGVGIKNYLLSDFTSQLLKSNLEIVLLHNLSSDAIAEIEKYHQYTFEQVNLFGYSEKPILKFIRESIVWARLQYNAKLTENPTILTNWNPSKKGVKKLFYIGVEWLAHFCLKKYNSILKLEKIYNRMLNQIENPYLEILKQINPTVVFNTHQRSLLSILPLKAAQKLNIKNIGAIFSWDNLPKARLTAPSDSYVVWSGYMKEELLTYYPEILEENIHITGTPQFEHYYNQKLIIPRDEFCNSIGLDAYKKIIVYSGGDLKTSPFDQLYVEALAIELQQTGLDQQYQVLVRPAPVDHSDRYDSIVKTYSDFVKLSRPKWVQYSDWSKTFPTFDDVILQVNTVYHSETVINVGSSMAFDYATMQKPAIYLNFNVVKSEHWDIKIINQFQHFKSMQQLNPVIWWHQKEDLATILKLIEQKTYSKEFNQWFEKINNFPNQASQKITQLIHDKTLR